LIVERPGPASAQAIKSKPLLHKKTRIAGLLQKSTTLAFYIAKPGSHVNGYTLKTQYLVSRRIPDHNI
jgi:hypothetical protein